MVGTVAMIYGIPAANGWLNGKFANILEIEPVDEHSGIALVSLIQTSDQQPHIVMISTRNLTMIDTDGAEVGSSN